MLYVATGQRELKRARHIGSFESEEDAARAYDREALKMLGSDAGLNFRESTCSSHSESCYLERMPVLYSAEVLQCVARSLLRPTHLYRVLR